MEKLLKLKEVEDAVGFKKSWLYERIAEDQFPKPIPFGSAKRWAASEIQAWMQQRISTETRA